MRNANKRPLENLALISLLVALSCGQFAAASQRRNLNDLLRLHAISDCITHFEGFVERSDNEGDRLLGVPPVVGLKTENLDLAHEYLSTMGESLRTKVRANLPRVSALAAALGQDHARYLFVRSTLDEKERHSHDQEHIMEVALEYRRARWLRLKGPPELNPLRVEGKLGELIDLLVKCDEQSAQSSEIINMDKLLKEANEEYEQQVWEKPMILADLRALLADGLQAAGYYIESCETLRRIGGNKWIGSRR